MPEVEHWSVAHEPAVNTQATISKAAESTGYHVITGIVASLQASAASAHGYLQVKDGSSVVWATGLHCGTFGIDRIEKDNFKIKGSKGNSVTLLFSAAAGANTIERVAMTGYTEYRQ